MKKKLNTIFFGTPDFSTPSLDLLHNHPEINICYVVSMPDRPAGRGKKPKSPEVIEYAKKYKIPYIQSANINKEADFKTYLQANDIDIFIVLAFAQFLGSNLLNVPKIGAFNIHTSLLPKYRGAAPIQYALLNGDSKTGVSIQKMVRKMDAGDIAHAKELTIHESDNGGLLYTRLKLQAALSLNEFIQSILDNKVTYTKQNEDKVSFAPTLKKEDGHLDFKNSDFNQIVNKLRALDPWPGTFFFLNGKRVKVFKIIKSSEFVKPGEISVIHSQIIVGLQNESARLVQLQVEGKKISSDVSFVNGLQKTDLYITEGAK